NAGCRPRGAIVGDGGEGVLELSLERAELTSADHLGRVVLRFAKRAEMLKMVAPLAPGHEGVHHAAIEEVEHPCLEKTQANHRDTETQRSNQEMEELLASFVDVFSVPLCLCGPLTSKKTVQAGSRRAGGYPQRTRPFWPTRPPLHH